MKIVQFIFFYHPSGDYDLILDGIHENMLQLHYVDPMMQKTVSLAILHIFISNSIHT